MYEEQRDALRLPPIVGVDNHLVDALVGQGLPLILFLVGQPKLLCKKVTLFSEDTLPGRSLRDVLRCERPSHVTDATIAIACFSR
jgi:hypothetical protein